MKPLKITDGFEERPWPNTTRAVRDDAAKRRRLRGAWMGLLAAATQLDSKYPAERGFAFKEIKRLAAKIRTLGIEPVPDDEA